LDLFLHRMKPSAETTILDVGGCPWNWVDCAVNAQITISNVHPVDIPPHLINRGMSSAIGDGCNLEYKDKAFDIVFSNSVIEHVGTWHRQIAFAAEVSRVGKALWIQTPARSFFIEPHLLTPFIHYLPTSVQKRLLRHFTVWGLMTKPTAEQIESFFNETRLLTSLEMNRLFPDCEILRERFIGLTKSFIAIRDGK